MNEGLIWTYEGRVIICLILAFLGLIVATVLTVVVFIRKAPGMRTQTNRQTGMVEEGLALWWLRFMAVFVGLPLLSLLVATGVEFTHWAADHIAVIAFAVFVVAMLTAAGLGIRANQRATRPAPEPQPILPAPEPVVGWSMPAPERQWDQR
jgi:uncharacterized membrane protein YccC